MDKSREQFEAHVLNLAQEKNYPYMDVVLLRADDEYATMWVDTMWQGWQASRVAVELPVICECCYSEEQISVSNEIYEALFEQGIGE